MTRFKYLILLCLTPLGLTLLDRNHTTQTAGVLFGDSGQNLGNEFSTDIALGDLDGDIDLDAFVINTTPHSQIWVNQGGEQGGTPGIYQDSGQILNTVNGQTVALGDLDGDLDLDAFVILNFGIDSYQVWINQGGAQGGTSGIFQRNSFTANNDLGTSVVLGDVDGDSDLDAYIAHIFDNDKLYLNDGAGLFTHSGQNLEPEDSQGADMADLDGDGDLDVFVAVNNGANTVWLNQGGIQGGTEGVFLDSGQALGNRTSLNVALGDVDNDGDMDAFVANVTENIVWINQGGAQGGTPGVFQDNGQLLGFSGSMDVKLNDLDGDNDLDAFVAEAAANTVWINQGGDQGGTVGQFADSGLALGSAFSRGVALGDVDGDSDSDAFVANSGPAPNKLYLNSSGPPQPPVNPEGWQIQLVETRGETGYSPTLAIDSNGYPHIAHVAHVTHPSGNSQRLYHLYWDGVRWHNELVTVGGEIGKGIALALDSLDNPHLAFTATGHSALGLTHAYWDGTQWQMQTVIDDSFGDNVSLALDSNDEPHLVYTVYEPTREFRYAVWDGTTWQTQTIEAVEFSFGSFSSLVLDSNNRPHVAYLHEADDLLKYAYYNGNNWQISTVDTSPHFAIFDPFFDLKLVGDMPVIAYYADFGEQLRYAQWDGNSWQLQTVITVPFPVALTGSLSLAIDSAGNPHISYAHSDNGVVTLRYVHWDGGQWLYEILDNSGSLGEANAIALDANDRPHIAYQDQTFKDLRYMNWSRDWQIRTVPDPGQRAGLDVQVQDRIPYLGYHNVSDGLVNLARWDDSWVFTPPDSVNNLVPQVSLAVSPNRQHLSYYDADAQQIMYGNHTEFGWDVQVVDNSGNVGQYNHILLAGGMDSLVHIAYWDETNRRIKLAVRDVLVGTFQLYTNDAGPGLTLGSGRLSATVLAEGNIGIAYYDAFNSGLRLAVWNPTTETWTDELVESAGGDMGRLNSIQTDGACGCPVVAYYDETNDAIRYGYKDSNGWHLETVATNIGGVTGLSLELGFESLTHPRLAYSSGNRSYFAYGQAGVWQFNTIAEGLNNAFAAALALDVRPHIATSDVVNGLQYIFRTATLDVDTALPQPPSPTGPVYNPLTPCPAIIDFFIEDNMPEQIASQTQPMRPLNAGLPLTDLTVFQGMTALFNATTGGQQYIDLYFDHAPEMAQIGLDDSALLWDSYGALQNFLPGLEALVTGEGDQFVVTQEMVDDALDIWTRIAAAASPPLTNIINSELAQSNNLQDFVGMTFDEWAIALGVNPPGKDVYLPLLAR